MSPNLDFSLADMVFCLSEHFLENSAKLTEESGCFFLYSLRQVCTKKAYEDILPRGLLGSPFPMLLLLRWRRRVHLVKDFPPSSTQRPHVTATLLPRLRCELVPLLVSYQIVSLVFFHFMLAHSSLAGLEDPSSYLNLKNIVP